MACVERTASSFPGDPDPAVVLTRQLRGAALIALVSMVVFGGADLHAARLDASRVLAVKGLQLVAVLATLAAVRRRRTWGALRGVALAFAASMFATAAMAAAVRGDPLTTPVVLGVSVMATAALVPWGLRYQLGLLAFAITAALVPLGAATTRAALFPFPGLPLLLAFALSLYVAAEIERSRRARDAAALAVRESEGRFRALAETAPVLIWMTDAVSRCVYLNPEWDRFLGRCVDPAEAATTWRDVHPEDRDLVAHRIAEATSARQPWEAEYRIRTGEGRYRWLLTRGVPRLGGAGAFEGYVGSAIDVTVRREEVEAFAAARNAALEAARVKADFLATMSHEIRTPMHGIFGMTELALDTHDERERRVFLERARGCAQTLMGLLDDILDLSRIEAGKLELAATDFDPRRVVQDVTDAVGLAAGQKGLTLTATVAATVPGRLRGDPKRLRQILVNLVGNAVKFTERGTVEVCIGPAASARDPSTALIRCTVRDTGIGIPREHLGHIFDAFTQVDTSIARAFGGTGLGLAITRSLVELMGGTIEVDSVAGAGSTFCVTLPFVVPAAGPAADMPRLDLARP